MKRPSAILRQLCAMAALLCAILTTEAQTSDTITVAGDTVRVGAATPSLPAITPTATGIAAAREMYPDFPVAAAFAALPDSIVPLLPQRTRLDMLDYGVAGQKRVLRNALYGHSSLDSLTAGFLSVSITEASSLQLGIYAGAKKGREVVVADYTISPRDAAPDSQLFFYDADMGLLPTRRVFKIPDAEDFVKVPKGSGRKKSEVAAMIPFPTVAYALDPEAGTITATLTADMTMTLESYDLIKQYLCPTIVYRWNGKRFEADRQR